jgi:hypothetical protein
VAPDSGHRLNPRVVSRNRGETSQIHCLLSRAANAFQSGAIFLPSWRLAKPMTYAFSLPVNIPTPASTNWLQETIEALVSVRLRRMSLEREYSGTGPTS